MRDQEVLERWMPPPIARLTITPYSQQRHDLTRDGGERCLGGPVILESHREQQEQETDDGDNGDHEGDPVSPEQVIVGPRRG